jgi:hypothetical protein
MSHKSLNIIMIAVSATIGTAVLTMGLTAASSFGARIIAVVFAAGPLSVFVLTLLFMLLPGRLNVKRVPAAVQKRTDGRDR